MTMTETNGFALYDIRTGKNITASLSGHRPNMRATEVAVYTPLEFYIQGVETLLSCYVSLLKQSQSADDLLRDPLAAANRPSNVVALRP